MVYLISDFCRKVSFFTFSVDSTPVGFLPAFYSSWYRELLITSWITEQSFISLSPLCKQFIKFSGDGYITTAEVTTLGSSSCSHGIKILNNIKTSPKILEADLTHTKWQSEHYTLHHDGYTLHPWFLATVVLRGSNSPSQRLWRHVAKAPCLSAGYIRLKTQTNYWSSYCAAHWVGNKAQRLNAILSNFPNNAVGRLKKKTKTQRQNKTKAALAKLTLHELVWWIS